MSQDFKMYTLYKNGWGWLAKQPTENTAAEWTSDVTIAHLFVNEGEAWAHATANWSSKIVDTMEVQPANILRGMHVQNSFTGLYVVNVDTWSKLGFAKNSKAPYKIRHAIAGLSEQPFIFVKYRESDDSDTGVLYQQEGQGPFLYIEGHY